MNKIPLIVRSNRFLAKMNFMKFLLPLFFLIIASCTSEQKSTTYVDSQEIQVQLEEFITQHKQELVKQDADFVCQKGACEGIVTLEDGIHTFSIGVWQVRADETTIYAEATKRLQNQNEFEEDVVEVEFRRSDLKIIDWKSYRRWGTTCK